MKRTALLLLMLIAMPTAAETFNIEIDYMVESGVNPHSHLPNQAEIDAIVEMFACQGHTLNIVIDDQITHYDLLRIDPDKVDDFWEYDGSADTFAELKAANFDSSGGGWHYCIFGHQMEKYSGATIVASGSSGKAEINGDDFVVTLGNFDNEIGTAFDRAATLAHEFGHNLGLTHCGAPGCDKLKANSPVLASVMSYQYQLQGLRTGLLCNELIPASAAHHFKEIDFSHGRMATLAENSMSEPLGTSWHSVDWNCTNGISGTVVQDLNTTQGSPNWCGKIGTYETIGDYDEWSNIVDAAKSNKSSELVGLESSECISWDEIVEFRDKAAECAQPVLITEACVAEEFYFLSQSGQSIGSGAWVDPLATVGLSQHLVDPGSSLVLMPGTYDEGGTGGVTLTEPVKLYSATSAVIK